MGAMALLSASCDEDATPVCSSGQCRSITQESGDAARGCAEYGRLGQGRDSGATAQFGPCHPVSLNIPHLCRAGGGIAH